MIFVCLWYASDKAGGLISPLFRKGSFETILAGQEFPNSYLGQMSLAENILETESAELCEELSDQYLKKACLAISDLDISQCKIIIEQDTFDWCIKQIASHTQNSGACHEIIDKEAEYYCFFNIAVSKEDPTICQGIEPIEYRPKRPHRDWCFMRIALKTEDKLICECIKEDRAYTDCNLRIDQAIRGSVEYNRLGEIPDICQKK